MDRILQKLFLLALLHPLLLAAQTSSDEADLEISMNSSAAVFEQALQKAPANENLLNGFYFATLREAYGGATKEVDSNDAAELDEIAARIHTAIPGSFTDNLVQYIESDRTAEDLDHLKAASSMAPLDMRVQQLMVDHYMINEDPRELKLRIGILHQSGYFDRTLITYAEDLLEMLPPNAVIFTNGADDTYPLIVCRELFGTRRDVTIAPLDLLGYKSFRDKINAATGVSLRGDIGREAKVKELRKSGKAQVFFALTLPHTWLSDMKGLEFCGLSIGQTGLEPTDLASRFEAYVDLQSIKEGSAIAPNYLPLLFTMIEYYNSIGNSEQVATIAAKIRAIAAHTSNPSAIIDRLP